MQQREPFYWIEVGLYRLFEDVAYFVGSTCCFVSDEGAWIRQSERIRHGTVDEFLSNAWGGGGIRSVRHCFCEYVYECFLCFSRLVVDDPRPVLTIAEDQTQAILQKRSTGGRDAVGKFSSMKYSGSSGVSSSNSSTMTNNTLQTNLVGSRCVICSCFFYSRRARFEYAYVGKEVYLCHTPVCYGRRARRAFTFVFICCCRVGLLASRCGGIINLYLAAIGRSRHPIRCLGGWFLSGVFPG